MGMLRTDRCRRLPRRPPARRHDDARREVRLLLTALSMGSRLSISAPRLRRSPSTLPREPRSRGRYLSTRPASALVLPCPQVFRRAEDQHASDRRTEEVTEVLAVAGDEVRAARRDRGTEGGEILFRQSRLRDLGMHSQIRQQISRCARSPGARPAQRAAQGYRDCAALPRRCTTPSRVPSREGSTPGGRRRPPGRLPRRGRCHPGNAGPLQPREGGSIACASGSTPSSSRTISAPRA